MKDAPVPRVRKVSRLDVARALRRGRRSLRRLGQPCRVSMDTFIRWLHTDTPYANPPFEAIVRNPYLVVHELVEIREVWRLGLRITKDVILRHPLEINRAHYEAARVEFEIATRDGAVAHLETRLQDLKGWIHDSSLSLSQKKRYRTLYHETARAIRNLRNKARQGEGL